MSPTRTPKSGFLRRLVLDNFWYKLLSLAMSFVLFWITRGTEHGERSQFVDVYAQWDASTDRILVTEVPERVRVTLRGSQTVLDTIRRDGIEAIRVELRESDRDFFFEPEAFDVPAGVEITQISPPSISLRWADRVQRTLPVRPTIDGLPAENLMLVSEPSAEPSMVAISGPAPEISPLDHVTTEPVPISRLSAGVYDQPVSLMRLPQHSSYEETSTVQVHFEIAPRVAEREFEQLAISVVGGETGQVRPNRVSVNVRGAPGRVEALQASDIVPVIDLRGIEAAIGGQVIPVEIRGLPPNISVTSIDPAEVIVVPIVRAPPPP